MSEQTTVGQKDILKEVYKRTRLHTNTQTSIGTLHVKLVRVSKTKTLITYKSQYKNKDRSLKMLTNFLK